MPRLLLLLAFLGVSTPLQAQSPLRWGGDSEGGAPFVEADPNDPAKMVGFDVEIAELVARRLGREPQFVQIAFSSLDQSARRGDFDIGLSGIEDIPARRASLAASLPYYEFREVITVRAADRGRFSSLAELRGRRVATLGGTMAYDILLQAEREHGIVAVSYDDDVHPYSDLALGRVDAVLLDHVLAERAMRRTAGLLHASRRRSQSATTSSSPRPRTRRCGSGSMTSSARRCATARWRRIFRKWQRVERRPAAALRASARDGRRQSRPGRDRWMRARLRAEETACPRPCRATCHRCCGPRSSPWCCPAPRWRWRCCSGVAIATGRVYGGPAIRAALTAYVEVMRGTPVLLQLFVIYYGVADLIRLPAFAAALLGLGLNYAAYESEIYRSALEAVPRGQLEAARILGLTRWQTLRLVRAPQAFRLALAPMTNDFVALLKDSSLVSVLTVVELTKQTQIFATNVGSWLVPGLLCAALYLAMSLPLSHLARRLEQRWKVVPS